MSAAREVLGSGAPVLAYAHDLFDLSTSFEWEVYAQSDKTMSKSNLQLIYENIKRNGMEGVIIPIGGNYNPYCF